MDYSFNKIKGIEYNSSFQFKPGQLIVDKFENVWMVLPYSKQCYNRGILYCKIIIEGRSSFYKSSLETIGTWIDRNFIVHIYLKDAYKWVQGKFWKVLVGK